MEGANFEKGRESISGAEKITNFIDNKVDEAKTFEDLEAIIEQVKGAAEMMEIETYIHPDAGEHPLTALFHYGPQVIKDARAGAEIYHAGDIGLPKSFFQKILALKEVGETA